MVWPSQPTPAGAVRAIFLRIGLLGIVLVCMASLAGCGSRAFVANQSVHIVSPAPLATVTAPFVVTWTASERSDGGFAVFVDLSPIAPGHSLRDLASDQCKQQPGCLNASYLAGLGVYLTRLDHVTIPALQPLAGTEGRQAHPVHILTVVMMDSGGRRVGDAAWQVEFRD